MTPTELRLMPLLHPIRFVRFYKKIYRRQEELVRTWMEEEPSLDEELVRFLVQWKLAEEMRSGQLVP